MPRDRTASLIERRRRGEDGYELDTMDPLLRNNDVVVVQMDALDTENGINGLLKLVDGIREQIENLRDSVKRVRHLHHVIESSPRPEDKATQEMDYQMATIKKEGGEILKKLNVLKEQNSKEEKIVDDEGNKIISARLRMGKAQYSALHKSFMEIMNDYHSSQMDHRDATKSRIRRQLSIIGTAFTDDQVEDMIENGNYSVFTHDIIKDAEEARLTLADLDARHKDLVKLEKSVKEVNEMFLELAILVESQGEIIDTIESHFESAREYVEKARKNVDQAEQKQKSARKRKIVIGLSVILILLVLIGIIVLTL